MARSYNPLHRPADNIIRVTVHDHCKMLIGCYAMASEYKPWFVFVSEVWSGDYCTIAALTSA